MKCEECHEEIEGNPIYFRNKKICLACATDMKEELEELIADEEEDDEDD